MKALVIHESMYGNTATVGRTIAASLCQQGLEVRAGSTAEITPAGAADADLLVVGGPTHAHGMSRASTRRAAVEDRDNTYPDRTVEPGLREWMEGLVPVRGRSAAAFDTRIDKPVLFTGSAAKGVARRLEHLGFRLVADPESFFVSGQNRLLEGEVDRAERWADRLVQGLTAVEVVAPGP
jgi:hypothetical protein